MPHVLTAWPTSITLLRGGMPVVVNVRDLRLGHFKLSRPSGCSSQVREASAFRLRTAKRVVLGAHWCQVRWRPTDCAMME